MTPLHIDVRDAARDDLADHYVWLAKEAGLDVAERMAASAEAVIFRLATEPGIGSPLDDGRPELSGLRKWRIPRFKLLIFYRVDGDSLVVLRVLHAAQDWMAWLEDG